MKNRGCVADAFWERFGPPNGPRPGYFWMPFGDHFGPKIEKTTSKKASKNPCRKVSKNHEKSIENDAKMDAKINDFSYLFEKGEKPRNYLKTNRILGFRHRKRYQKSIKNQCKIDARKSYAKRPEKRHPKIDAEI